MRKAKNVEEYIAAAPAELRAKLREMRSLIRAAAPGAIEKLSYGMPYYGLEGRLAYFAWAKNHIGIYIPPPVIQMHAKELKGYETAKATVRFPHGKKLPKAMIRKLVKTRIALNLEKSAAATRRR